MGQRAAVKAATVIGAGQTSEQMAGSGSATVVLLVGERATVPVADRDRVVAEEMPIAVEINGNHVAHRTSTTEA